MSRILNRRTVLLAVAVLIAAVVVPPYIYVNHFRARIAGALSRSLGRQVSIGDVSLRLFPTPGLNLSRVVVDDDPSFSQEPLLRADDVTASLRLTSLWRGRLEIASLTFQYPSLNLVRRPDGHWNLESLLERARQTPVLPTAKRTAGQRVRFPYIESVSGRVNLKLGDVKTVYALADADFALWLASEDEWNLRLAARPIRTDANLSDTGTVKIQGKVRRGASLSDTPLSLLISLRDAQLGQLSTFVYGRDRGWRGSAATNLTLEGTPAALRIKLETSIADFRRYDIATTGNLTLVANCSAGFSSRTQVLSDLDCISPFGNGNVEARGNLTGLLPIQSYEISLTARDFPASQLAAWFRHIKKDLPEDISAEGAVNARFAVKRSETGDPAWNGAGVLTGLAFQSSRLKDPITIGEVRFGMPVAPARINSVKGRPMTTAPQQDSLVIEPFAIDLGGNSPAHAQGSFSRDGYRLALNGSADIERLLQVSEAWGVAAPRFAPKGSASVDLSLQGEWAGFAQPLVLGSAKISATTTVNGINAPVQISSATINLQQDGVNVQDLSFGWPKLGIAVGGALQVPRRCTTIETCPVQFQLRSELVDIADLNTLLNPQAEKRPWYAIIGTGAAKPPLLKRITASGTLTLTSLKIGDALAKNVSATVTLEHGVLRARDVLASGLGGKLSGTVRADFDASPPKFETNGKLDSGSVAALSGARRQSWGTGRLDATFALTAAGLDAGSILKTADGSIDYLWRNGTMALALDGGAGPLRIRDFRGTATLHSGRLSFTPSRMETPGGIYTVSGTASLDRQLGLTLTRGRIPAYEITGTLEKPLVKAAVLPAPATQARLRQ